jgi:predicted enzyme related to lactoylglutathione lyase
VIAATHILIYADDAEAARAFLRDVLGWENIDAGEGWLIFALPPAELGVHPAEERGPSGTHALFLMCHDIEDTVRELEAKGAEFTMPVTDAGFGLITHLRIPGGGEIGLYEPKHASPLEEFDARTSPDRE